MTGALVPVDPDTCDRTTRVLRDVSDALAKLAAHGTPTQIAFYLGAVGITGHRGASGSCPVRRYLTAAVPDMCHCGARPDSAYFLVGNVTVARDRAFISSHDGRGWASVDLPDPVAGFVSRFDYGAYPALEDS